MHQVLTANRLGHGDVVYWNVKHGWVPSLAQADVFEVAEARTALEAAAEWVRRREVVNPYLFAVRTEDGAIAPVKAREVIRAAGPTVRRDLGKQANGA